MARKLPKDITAALLSLDSEALNRAAYELADGARERDLARDLVLARDLDLDLARDRDRALARDLALVRNRALVLDRDLVGFFDADLVATAAGWAKEDLSRTERKRISETADLGVGYASYLLVLWARLVTVAWAISVPEEADPDDPNSDDPNNIDPDVNAEDEPAGKPRFAIEKLTPEATGESAAALEPVTTPIQRFVDDSTQPP